jgi:ribokinase
VALITVEDSGQNNICVAGGANAQVDPADVEAALTALAPFDLLQTPLDTNMESILVAARTARKLGARVMLNPAPAQPLPAELLTLVDFIAPNEIEAAMLTGIEVGDEDSALAAAQKLHGQAHCNVILTLGGRGALLLDTQGSRTRLPAHAVRVVDTTAAGDAFVAGLSVGLAEGQTLAAAARLGNAAGALAVTRPGAQPSLPHRAEVEALLHASPDLNAAPSA